MYICGVNANIVDTYISMSIPTINYITWHLKYIGVNAGTISGDLVMEMK